jgi:hypothetical protein
MLDKYPWLKVDTIRALMVVTIPVIVSIVALFGLDPVTVAEWLQGWQGKLLVVVEAIGVAWALYARTFKPTPPITDAAVNKTAQVVAKQEAAKQKGFIRAAMLGLLLVVAVPALVVQGCTQTQRAIKEADTSTDYALIFLEGYRSGVKTAADLRDSGRLAGNDLTRVQALEIKAFEFVKPIEPLVAAWEASHSETDAQAIQAAVDRAIVAVAEFVRAVKQARGTE